MKLHLLFFALLALFAAAFGSATPVHADAPVVTSIAVGTGYTNEKLTGVGTTFSVKSHKLYSVMHLKKMEMGSRYKAVWVAVDAGGMKNYKIGEFPLPKALANNLQATVELPRDWPAGTFRVDWFRDNKPAGSRTFSIK